MVSKEGSNQTTDGLFLNNEQLHKLLCYLTTTVVDGESVDEKEDRVKLLDFSYQLQWDIADKLGYDIEVGGIDPKTYEYFTFKSRW
jgi:hypothetical protein